MKPYLFAFLAIIVLGGGVALAMRFDGPHAAPTVLTEGDWRIPQAPAVNDVLEGCAACHAIRPGDVERSAPSLVGVVGRPVAAVDWFGYSPALRKWGGSWTEDRLKTYLHDPVGTVPGTIKTLSPISDTARLDEIVRALGAL